MIEELIEKAFVVAVCYVLIVLLIFKADPREIPDITPFPFFNKTNRLMDLPITRYGSGIR